MMYGNFTERELDAFWMGVESEQERIIKILQRYSPQEEGLRTMILAEWAIATIKGENYEHPNF